MKKNILLFSFLLIFTLSIEAQVTLSFEPESISVSDYIDLSDNDYELVGYATVTNIGDEAISLRWNRVIEDMPEEWGVQVCDLNLCYNESIYSNFVPGEIEIPVPLEPGASTNMDIHVKPRGVSGNGRVIIELSDTNTPDEIISTGTYDFDALVVTSTEDLNQAPLSVFPNPTADYFNIRGGNGIDRVVLYNILGREMRSFNVAPGQRYHIGDLPNGLYLASMVDNSKGIVKTLRLKKSTVRP
jgi:hypothetical protein